MQDRSIDNAFAEAFLLRAYQDEGLLSPRTLPLALKQWREPSFQEFRERNVWSLFNAMTFALGERSEQSASPRRRDNPTWRSAVTGRGAGSLHGGMN